METEENLETNKLTEREIFIQKWNEQCQFIKSVLKNSITRVNNFNKKYNNLYKMNFLTNEQELQFCKIFLFIYSYINQSIKDKTSDIFDYNSSNKTYSILIKSNSTSKNENKSIFLTIPDVKIHLENKFFIKMLTDTMLFFLIKYNYTRHRPLWLTSYDGDSILVDEFILKRQYMILLPFMVNFVLSIPEIPAVLQKLADDLDINDINESSETNLPNEKELSPTEKGGSFYRKNKKNRKTLKRKHKKRNYKK